MPMPLPYRRWRLIAIGVSVLLILSVLALGANVVGRGPVVGIDAATAGQLQGLRAPWLDSVMMMASALGDGSQRTAVTALAALYLLWRRRWPWALALVLAMIGSALLTPAFKTAFHVARPSALYSGAEAYSFPSGHATSAAALYLTLAWMASYALARRWRPLAWLLAALAILVTAISRVYVGAHWPSDVVAGVALGGALASLAIAFASGAKPASPDARPELDGVAFITAVAIVAAVLGPHAFGKAQRLYAPYLYAVRVPPAP